MSQRVLSFHYTLKNTAGEIIDASAQGEPLSFLQGSGQIIPGLETRLLLMQVGDKAQVKLSAQEAYGEVDPKMFMSVPKEELSHLELSQGSFLQLQLGDQVQVVRVHELGDEQVVLNGNHPLAGEDLEFEVELVFERPATESELVHGHAHGIHGNAHH